MVESEPLNTRDIPQRYAVHQIDAHLAAEALLWLEERCYSPPLPLYGYRALRQKNQMMKMTMHAKESLAE